MYLNRKEQLSPSCHGTRVSNIHSSQSQLNNVTPCQCMQLGRLLVIYKPVKGVPDIATGTTIYIGAPFCILGAPLTGLPHRKNVKSATGEINCKDLVTFLPSSLRPCQSWQFFTRTAYSCSQRPLLQPSEIRTFCTWLIMYSQTAN